MLCAVLPRVMTYYGGDFDLLHNVSANVATSAFSYPCTDSDKTNWAACAGHNKPPGYTPVLQRNICNDTSLLGHTANNGGVYSTVRIPFAKSIKWSPAVLETS